MDTGRESLDKFGAPRCRWRGSRGRREVSRRQITNDDGFWHTGQRNYLSSSQMIDSIENPEEIWRRWFEGSSQGGSLKVNLRRFMESAPMASKNAGSREEKYIFHLKKSSKKIFSSNFCLDFFLMVFHDFPIVNRHRFTIGKSWKTMRKKFD